MSRFDIKGEDQDTIHRANLAVYADLQRAVATNIPEYREERRDNPQAMKEITLIVSINGKETRLTFENPKAMGQWLKAHNRP